jgi:glycosyltransferase involved in cell wall biosynthesis
MRVCFFARVLPKSSRAVRLEALQRAEFYKQDIDILRHLGFEVTIATAWAEIPSDVDFYFVWWWQWGFMPMWKNGLPRKPCLITGVFDFQWTSGRGDYFHRSPWQRWLMRYALKRAAANIFISQLEYREVSQAFEVNNPSYIPLVVDTQTFCPTAQPREDFALAIGRMDQGNTVRKCFPELLRAIPLIRTCHPRMRFVIAGYKGNDFPKLDLLAHQLGVTQFVEFPGAIPREKKIELMQRCKVFLSPSRHEGFGLAILEAMSCGAPVVSSPVGAVPEVVSDGGLLVDGTSPEAIAAAVNRYLADDALREEVGHRARLRAERVFPYSRRKRDLERVISGILGKG